MTKSDYTAEVNRFFYVLFSPSARLMMHPEPLWLNRQWQLKRMMSSGNILDNMPSIICF